MFFYYVYNANLFQRLYRKEILNVWIQNFAFITDSVSISCELYMQMLDIYVKQQMLDRKLFDLV